MRKIRQLEEFNSELLESERWGNDTVQFLLNGDTPVKQFQAVINISGRGNKKRYKELADKIINLLKDFQ